MARSTWSTLMFTAILGAAETVLGLTDAFEAAPGAPGVYRPVSLSQRGKRAVTR